MSKLITVLKSKTNQMDMKKIMPPVGTKRAYFYVVVSVSILFFLTYSCSSEVEFSISKKNSRTIFAYLAGDNDLSEEVPMKCEALLSGWKPAYGNLLIMADRATDTPVLIQATVRGGRVVGDTLKRYSEHNSASPSLLGEAIDDMLALAPARSYGMLLFSHASGWLPAGAFAQPQQWRPRASSRSIFEDQGREMDIADFVAAIPDNVFEFMTFDMCFMASVEALYALRHKAKYVVASAAEIVSPGFIPIYPANLRKLYQPTPDLTGFATAFFDYFNRQKGLYRSATISVVNMSELEALAMLVKELPRNSQPLPLDEIQHYDRREKHNLFFDLGSYLHLRAVSDAQHQHIDEVLERCVIFKANTRRLIRLPIVAHSGLSVYLDQSALPYLNLAHRETEWAKATGKE